MIGAVQLAVNELGGKLADLRFQDARRGREDSVGGNEIRDWSPWHTEFDWSVVASVWVYGVTTYAFNQRRKEIGIRMSLGAQRTDILKIDHERRY